MRKKIHDYRTDLRIRLMDPEYAAGYLSFAITESLEAFLLALRDVTEVQKGMKKVSLQAGVNRENLYRMLSEGGNPRLKSLSAVLGALGFDIAVKNRSRHPSGRLRARVAHGKSGETGDIQQGASGGNFLLPVTLQSVDTQINIQGGTYDLQKEEPIGQLPFSPEQGITHAQIQESYA